MRASELDVACHGEGQRVVLVHGSVVGAQRTWRRQLTLGDRWTLVLPNRPGFAASPPLARGDFQAEAPLIAELLGEGAHLVGHSYGAVIALYAAALRPQAVRSLTVSEPGCMRMAAGNPAVDAQIAAGELLYEHAQEFAPAGLPARVPRRRRLDARDARGARRRAAGGSAAVHARTPRPGRPSRRLSSCARRRLHKLVISGGHSPVFEAVCDAVAERLQAARATIPGRGHTIPATGEPYNARLHSFLAEHQR